jgi:hypothetical protein
MTEADTCRTCVLPKLEPADWENKHIARQMVLTSSRIMSIGGRHTGKAAHDRISSG